MNDPHLDQAGLDHAVDAVLAARGARDEQALAAAFAAVPEQQLDALFAAIDRHPAASLDGDAATGSRAGLHAALAAAGFDATEAARWASLADAGAGPLVNGYLAEADVDLDGLAHRVAIDLAASEPITDEDAGRIRRYLARVLDGRHDFARLARPARAAVLRACAVPSDVAGILTSMATPPRTAGMAAARGGAAPGDAIDDPTHRDRVDELFDADTVVD